MPKIIIVDDDTLNLYLHEILLSEDYEVVKFHDPLKMIRYLKTNTADLVISDLMMPELDGFQLFIEIKKFKPDIPFLFLSAQDDPQNVEKAEKMGAVGYLFKPVDFEKLFTSIENSIINV